jgi:hypothetical protein
VIKTKTEKLLILGQTLTIIIIFCLFVADILSKNRTSTNLPVEIEKKEYTYQLPTDLKMFGVLGNRIDSSENFYRFFSNQYKSTLLTKTKKPLKKKCECGDKTRVIIKDIK